MCPIAPAMAWRRFGTAFTYQGQLNEAGTPANEPVDQDDEDYLFVTERGLMTILVEAMRNLRAENQDLRDQNESLEVRLTAVEAALEKMNANTNEGGVR